MPTVLGCHRSDLGGHLEGSFIYPVSSQDSLQLGDKVLLVEVASSSGNQACLTVDHVTSVSFSLSNDLGALLLCPGMYPLATANQEAESSRKLTHLLNAVTDALVWVIAKSGISSQQQSVRLANLLMLLSHVRHIRYKPVGHCSSGCGQSMCSGLWEHVGKFVVDMVECWNGNTISVCTCTKAWHIVGVEMSATHHLIGFLWQLVGPTWM